MGQEESKGSQKNGPINNSKADSPWFAYCEEAKSSQKSQISPFYQSQLSYLEKLFTQIDKKNLKSIELKEIEEIPFIKYHVMSSRIVELFEQELKKIKTKKVSIEIFLHLLTVFHFETDIEQKYRYLFRLYDFDRDFKLNHNDLMQAFMIIFAEKGHILGEEGVKSMASEAIARYGVRGEIKLENFMEHIPQDEVREVLTFRFNKKYW